MLDFTASNAPLYGAKTVMPFCALSVSARPGTFPTAVTSVVSSGLVLAALATGCGPMLSSEPGASPCGSMLQAGPKTSALVVTPSAAAGAAAGAGLADAAGALAGALLAGAVLAPQAVRDTVRAASAPTVANRKVFRTVFPP